MSLGRRRFLRGTAGLAASALVLAACGDGDSSSGGTRTLRVGIPTDVNPANLLGVLSANEPVGRLVLEGLVDYDAAQGKHVPWLATKWSFGADQRSLTLDLRDDVTFHGGRKFTAKDVVYSVQAAKAPDSGAQAGSLLALATNVSADGDTRVTFTFDKPVGESFLDALVWTRIVDEPSFADLKSGKKVVGTGPYVWTKWTPGSSVELDKNTAYWQAGKPTVDKVTLRVIGQSQAMLAALRSGQIDVAHRMVPRDVQTVASDKSLRVDVFDPFAETYLGVDVTVKPFTDKRARQALAWALDRDRIAQQVFAGYAEATDFPFPTSVPGLAEQSEQYRYDVQRAKTLLAEAGGAGATVTIAALSTDPILVAVRDIVQFNLTEIGLTVKPVSWDAAQVPKALGSGTTGGLWINRVSSGSLSPASMAATLLPYRPSKNASNVTDPAYAQLAAAAEAGTAEANQALAKYVVDEAWHLTVVRTKNPLVVKSGVGQVRLDTNGYLDLAAATVA
ncbi:ABC transporter substrate-binding protein [Phytohabitans sp. ZYX-F-186]|uniref:ABC transporter substrate-binding protein n=1 Tax=Phytohabitans maris TaxID=3071409 RepID=A0ABU0Z9L5_9ACTN|nr:ABC transporter substrate-binding protein [Phytohabitans sp. ZYX-F-186]MDQ7903683.1 ABC transporter substrate-binding protein [Phytohabitans sp. ZYX-F-186]